MPTFIPAPQIVQAAGNKPKLIEEFVGRVQYSTPGDEGAEYIAVCLPAFAPEIVHRDA
ncbi:MAG: hypothetical protein WD872_04495 [Pirellulaceae bacterium]